MSGRPGFIRRVDEQPIDRLVKVSSTTTHTDNASSSCPSLSCCGLPSGLYSALLFWPHRSRPSLPFLLPGDPPEEPAREPPPTFRGGRGHGALSIHRQQGDGSVLPRDPGGRRRALGQCHTHTDRHLLLLAITGLSY